MKPKPGNLSRVCPVCLQHPCECVLPTKPEEYLGAEDLPVAGMGGPGGSTTTLRDPPAQTIEWAIENVRTQLKAMSETCIQWDNIEVASSLLQAALMAEQAIDQLHQTGDPEREFPEKPSQGG